MNYSDLYEMRDEAVREFAVNPGYEAIASQAVNNFIDALVKRMHDTQTVFYQP